MKVLYKVKELEYDVLMTNKVNGILLEHSSPNAGAFSEHTLPENVSKIIDELPDDYGRVVEDTEHIIKCLHQDLRSEYISEWRTHYSIKYNAIALENKATGEIFYTSAGNYN